MNYIETITDIIKYYKLDSNLIDMYLYYEDYLYEQKNDKKNEWIKQIYLATNKYVESLRNDIKVADSNFFISMGINEDIKKYLCMFPSNSVILIGTFEDGFTAKGDMDYYYLDSRYVQALIENIELIQKGIFRIAPYAVEHHEDAQMQYAIDTIEERFYLGIKSPPRYLLQDKAIYINNDSIDKLFFNFPWLYGASVEDYLEIVSKNKTLFESYKVEIDKLISQIKEGNEVAVFKDINEAHISIQIEFEKKRSQLRRKGVMTAVGFAMTFIPIFFPLDPGMKANISAIVGTTGIINAMNVLGNEIDEMRKIGINNPLWLSWNWKRLYGK